MKKPVLITSLAMRFRESDGWVEENLKPYLSGKLVLRGFGPNEELERYWILDVGSHLDIDRMVSDGVVGEAAGKDYWAETRVVSDIDAMKLRNG